MALDSSDSTLAERLRQEDPEQFQTLVRMHLSFVLDLNTDDYDCAVEKTKYRPSKWTFVPFAKKPKCLSKGVMEGAPLTQEGICQVYQLIEYLGKEENICQEGIFRRTGKLTRQQELKTLLNRGMTLNLENSHFSIHDCASVLKNFLAELPEPLLTDSHYPVYCQIAELLGNVVSSPGPSSELRLLHSLRLLLLLLPVENRTLLRDVLQLLHRTASQENGNKMSADSLATIFTPHLLCPRKTTPEQFHANSQTMTGVVAFMIRKGLELFEIPPKLATDIRAYWLERERRKLTVQKELNESVRDSTAANTVFSFVNHELTAQAHSTDPTRSELAQLYAHIQSLPESSKKRKLIRQFNKGNGLGTPVQHLRSKSLGDSIKESMMTPRCRKPVVVLSGSNICHLTNITNRSQAGSNVKLLQSSSSSSLSSKKCEPNKENASCCSCNNTSSLCCNSKDSLTSTFKSYLMSRSVLTATPVDLSFSSRTGDFDTSSEGEGLLNEESLSDSLMYCLDGNNPVEENTPSSSTASDDNYPSTSRSKLYSGVHETSL